MKPTLRQRPWARIVAGLVCVLSLAVFVACGSRVALLTQEGAYRSGGAQQLRERVALRITRDYTETVAFYISDLPLTDLESVVEDVNFFYTIRDESGTELATGGTEGTAQATSSVTVTVGNEQFLTVTGSLRSALSSQGESYHTLRRLGTLLAFRSALVVGTIVSGVLALLSLLFLLWPDPAWAEIGESDEMDGEDLSARVCRRPWVDRLLPTDLLVIVVGIILLCCLAALSDGWEYCLLPGSTAAAALVGSLVFLPTLCSLVRRGREGALGENLLFRRLLHPFGRFFRWMGGGIRETVQKLPLFWQAGLLFVGFGFLELLCLLGVWNSGAGMALLWLLLKVVELIFFIRLVLQLIHLQAGGQKLTQGDLNYQLPLEKLHGPFRAHGEALNNIRQGIQHAVEEQMKSERMKTELITNVSHDIKTPLTAIVSYVDLLKQEPMPNEKAKEYLDVLDRQSARLKKLTEDLVEASKATTGNLTVDLQPTDVNVFLGQTTGEYEERLAAKQLTLCLTPAEGTPIISADGRLLWRVFENLFSNIQKYAQPGTRVYLTCQATDEQVTITFRNISAEPLNISADELMERFVRGDASRNTEGSGLGLSIARSLTQLQHGTFALAVDGDLFKAILTFPRLRDGEG